MPPQAAQEAPRGLWTHLGHLIQPRQAVRGARRRCWAFLCMVLPRKTSFFGDTPVRAVGRAGEGMPSAAGPAPAVERVAEAAGSQALALGPSEAAGAEIAGSPTAPSTLPEGVDVWKRGALDHSLAQPRSIAQRHRQRSLQNQSVGSLCWSRRKPRLTSTTRMQALQRGVAMRLGAQGCVVAVVADPVLCAPRPEVELATWAAGGRGEPLRAVDVVASRAVNVRQSQHQHRRASHALRSIGVFERSLNWDMDRVIGHDSSVPQDTTHNNRHTHLFLGVLLWVFHRPKIARCG